MRTQLYHDYVIQCARCNLRCDYCLSIAAGESIGEYADSSCEVSRVLDVESKLQKLMKLHAICPAPILKISGGELFLFVNIVDLLGELSKHYAHVQVLTNGLLVSAKAIESLAAMGNVGLNISMDGHTPAMNSHRFSSENLNRRLLDVLGHTLSAMGSVEITSVLTDANADDYESFLEYLESLPGKSVAFPIPVRGNDVQSYFSSLKRRQFASQLVNVARKHPTVTGPIAYYEGLASFLANDPIARKDQCFIPKLSVQLFDSGAVTPCPLGWTSSIGNVDEPGQHQLMANIANHRLYDILTHPRRRPSICHDCYAQTDMLNLFLRGLLSIRELSQVPMFSSEKVLAALEQVNAELPR